MGFCSMIKGCMTSNKDMKWTTFTEKPKVRKPAREVGILDVARFPKYIDEEEMENELIDENVWKQTFVYTKHHSVLLQDFDGTRFDTEEVNDIHSILVAKPMHFIKFYTDHVIYAFKAASLSDRDAWARTLLFVEGKTQLKKSIQSENLEDVGSIFRGLYDLTTHVAVDYDLMRSSIFKSVLDYLRDKWEVSTRMQEILLVMLPQIQRHAMPLDDLHLFIKRYLLCASGSHTVTACVQNIIPNILNEVKMDINVTMLDVTVELMFSGKYCRESEFDRFARKLVAGSDAKSFIGLNMIFAMKLQLTVIRTTLSQYGNPFVESCVGCVLKKKKYSKDWVRCGPDAVGSAANHKLYEEMSKLVRLTKFMEIMLETPLWRITLTTNMREVPKSTRALDNKFINDILSPLIKKFALVVEPELQSSLWKGDSVGWMQVFMGAFPHNSKTCTDDLCEILQVYGSKSIQESHHFYGELKHFLHVLTRPEYAHKRGIVKALESILELRLVTHQQALDLMDVLLWSKEGQRVVAANRQKFLFLLRDLQPLHTETYNLTRFDLSGPHVHRLESNYTDERLVAFYLETSYTHLHTLDCSNSKITGDICKLLRRMNHLRTLLLKNTQFDDLGLHELADSSLDLFTLDVSGSKVTMEGCFEFQKKKPKTDVLCTCQHTVVEGEEEE